MQEEKELLVGHNYIGDNYTGHNYIVHNYTGLRYTGHDHMQEEKELLEVLLAAKVEARDMNAVGAAELTAAGVPLGVALSIKTRMRCTMQGTPGA